MAKKDVQITVSAIDKASKEFNKIAATAEGARAKIELMHSNLMAIGAGAGLTGIASYAVKAAKDWGNAVDDLADITGATGEEASKLLVIGKRMGMGIDDAAGTFAKFGKAVSNATDEMSTSGSKSNDMLSRIGFTLEDIKGKNLYEVFQKVADKMRDMEDGADKDRVAMELFGKSGYKLHDMLSMSREEMDKVVKKAEDMGLIISSETAQAWEKFDRQLSGVTGTLGKVAIAIGNELFPVVQGHLDDIQSLTDKYATLSDENRKFYAAAAETAAKVGLVGVGVKSLQGIMSMFGASVVNPWIALTTATWLAYDALKSYGDEKARVTGYGGGGQIMMERTKDLNGGTKIQYYKKDSSTLSGYRYLSSDELAAYQENQGSAASLKGDSSYLSAMNDPKKLASLQESINRQREIEKITATTLRDKYDAGADKEAEKLQKAIDHVTELQASLQSKITGIIGTTAESSTDRLKAELKKMDNDIADWQSKGADTSGAIAKRNEYEKTSIAEIARVQRESLADMKNDAAMAYAQMTGDKKAQADAEYQITMTAIAKEKEERWKATGDQKSVLDWKAKKEKEAAEKHAQTLREISMEDKNRAIEEAQFLVDLEGKTQDKVNKLKRSAVEKAIENDRVILAHAKLSTDQRYRVEQDLVSNLNKLYSLNAQDITTASQEAYRQISNQTSDYSKIMVDAWNDVNSHVEGHLVNMVTGAEKFSEGIRGITKDLANDIITTFTKMAYELYVLNPLKSWFSTNILGISGTGGQSGFSYTSPYAGTGYSLTGKASGGPVSAGQMYQVNELGIETFVPSVNGHILTAGQTRQAMSSVPNINVTVINNGNKGVQVSQRSTYDSDTQTLALELVIDGLARNVNGSRDDVASILGVAR